MLGSRGCSRALVKGQKEGCGVDGPALRRDLALRHAEVLSDDQDLQRPRSAESCGQKRDRRTILQSSMSPALTCPSSLTSPISLSSLSSAPTLFSFSFPLLFSPSSSDRSDSPSGPPRVMFKLRPTPTQYPRMPEQTTRAAVEKAVELEDAVGRFCVSGMVSRV